MRIFSAMFLFAVALLVNGTVAYSNTVELKIARSGSVSAEITIDSLPKGPDYVLAILPFPLGKNAVVLEETGKKDSALIVSHEPRGVLAVTAYGGSATVRLVNAVDAVDGDRAKIRLEKQGPPYESLVTTGNPSVPLVETAYEAILEWTVHIDLPENFEDLKPQNLPTPKDRITLQSSDIGNGLVLDIKNPAAQISDVSNFLGSIYTNLTLLLVSALASITAWLKAPRWLYWTFILLVTGATVSSVYRGAVYGWTEGLATLGGISGGGTLAVNFILLLVITIRARSIAVVSGVVKTNGHETIGVTLKLLNSDNKVLAKDTSQRDGSYKIEYKAKNPTEECVLEASPGFGDIFQRDVIVERGDSKVVDVDLQPYNVIGNWELDSEATQNVITDNLRVALQKRLQKETRGFIASALQHEVQYPKWINVYQDNHVSADGPDRGVWKAMVEGDGDFEISLRDSPDLGIMRRADDKLILSRRTEVETPILAAVYTKKPTAE